MNCQNFEGIIDELAPGRLMDAAEREAALAHTADCARCAARLEDGRALTAGLRTLAAQAVGAEAPARVEAALLAAFRERRASAERQTEAAAPRTVAPVVPLLPTVRPSVSLRWFPRWAQGAAVAAASVLLVVGLYGIFREQSAPETRLAQTGGQGSNATPDNARLEAKDVPPADRVVADVAGDKDKVGDENDEARRDEYVAPRRSNRAGGAKAQLASYNRGGRAPTANAAAVNDANAPEEVATEFIPLVNGGRLSPGDAGHVIRVEVPRSALASFGLPVNADRLGGRVKADVLMGEDGIARAIRFVR